ncbi:MAG: GGDEF domain-containing protein [Chloroflexi bacterium]|nr:MAG: GGDEF domain-containing protein [Chloroflexota bacterium]
MTALDVHRVRRGQPRTLPRRARGSDTAAAPEDVLVFEQSEAGFSLVGGTGRGTSWAGIVDIARDRSLVSRAWDAGVPLRLAGARPSQVAGPYHAKHAVAVPVGDRHVVVLGSQRAIDLRDTDVLRLAAAAVDRAKGVPADKLLADELELVHALRTLMAYRPENVRDTLRHIATVAAAALSCEVALIRVEREGEPVTEAIGIGPVAKGRLEPGVDPYLAACAEAGEPSVNQASHPDVDIFGIEVASYLTLPIGADPALGALALAHSIDRPRGFTSLCQRIGRAVADAAELLISQAAAREQLAAERDLLARISSTDALTGVANRQAWNDEATRLAAAPPVLAYVLSCDLDGLKAANDWYGHAAGDALLRATARLLTTSTREGDLVARIGGDEFAVLLRDADAVAARRVRSRIRRAERGRRPTDDGLVPRLSVGLAEVVGNDIEAARHVADARMYADKRRRAAAGPGASLRIRPRDRRDRRGRRTPA